MLSSSRDCSSQQPPLRAMVSSCKWLLVASVLVLLSFESSAREPRCSYSSCEECLTAPECAWCSESYSCVLISDMQLNESCTRMADECSNDRDAICAAATNCDECIANSCYWCPESMQPCTAHFDEFRCCSDCTDCERKRIFSHITVTLISACGFALFSLLIATCVYSFYKYYWTRRHFFEVLE